MYVGSLEATYYRPAAPQPPRRPRLPQLLQVLPPVLQAHHFYLMMDLYYFCVLLYIVMKYMLHSLMEAATAEAASVYLQYIRSLDGGGNGSGGLSTPHGPRGTL